MNQNPLKTVSRHAGATVELALAPIVGVMAFETIDGWMESVIGNVGSTALAALIGLLWMRNIARLQQRAATATSPVQDAQ